MSLPPSEVALLSVRGEARRQVPPDLVRLPGSITVIAAGKAAALRGAAQALDRLTADLTGRGGRALDAAQERHDLTWSAHAASTSPEHLFDERTGRYQPSGKVRADVALTLTVRALDGLDELGALLAEHEELSVHSAVWAVDADNPAWPPVRAEAVHDAVRKARDYAAALGGALVRVEHLADVGLLDGAGNGGGPRFVAQAMSAGGAYPGEDAAAPSLDPVPQELVALVEARFVATGMALAGA
ncbi:MAG TPA: SIMPL domain-containing protein [Mycobacteriales bacterium]|nr:SIMPL domain-containing protein [Mycobacteriales bacterium]